MFVVIMVSVDDLFAVHDAACCYVILLLTSALFQLQYVSSCRPLNSGKYYTSFEFHRSKRTHLFSHIGITKKWYLFNRKYVVFAVL